MAGQILNLGQRNHHFEDISLYYSVILHYYCSVVQTYDALQVKVTEGNTVTTPELIQECRML